MNDDARFERLFADGLHELTPRRAPDRLRTQVKAATDEMRPRARWLALIKQPPMRTNARLAVGSPTARVAAIVAATLLLTLLVVSAGIAGSQLLATTGPIVVDQSGDGTYETITEAVAMADDGAQILVRPGSYVEAVLIDKDITLAGDGPREDIVISAPADGPTTAYGGPGASKRREPAYALLLENTQAEVRGLTFAAPEGEFASLVAGVVVDGGSPTLTDLVFDRNEFGLLIHSGSTATLTDSRMTAGGIEYSDSEPLIVSNVLRDGAGISGGEGGVIRDNALSGGGGIGAIGTPTIEGNTVSDAESVGISSSSMEGDAGAPVIRNNIISGSRHGIQVGSGWEYDPSADAGTDAATATPLVSGNDISAELNAVSVNATNATISDNSIHDSWNGIVLVGGGSPEVSDNEVDVDGVAIDVGANTSPTVDGNDACGGSSSIKIHETATPSMGENTTC